MANMKVFKVEADTRGAVKNLKDIEIQTIKVITAQEVLQGILASPEPLKNINKIIPAYNKLSNTMESISKMSPVGAKAMNEIMDVAEKRVAKQLEGAAKISQAHKNSLDELKKERQTREKDFNALQKEIEEKQTLMQQDKLLGKEISEEDKKWLEEKKEKLEEFSNAQEKYNEQSKSALKDTLQSMQKSTDEVYARQKDQIKLKYALEEQTIRNTYDITATTENNKMEVLKQSVEDETALRVALNIKLQDLEDRKNTELKKNEEEHQKASASIVQTFLKERTSGMEKYVDNTTKLAEKSAKKMQKELGAYLEGVDEKVIASIAKQSSEQQKNTTATKEATTATKEATEAAKKYLDIQATRINYLSEIDELKELQKERKDTFDAQIKQFDEEIKAAGDNEAAKKEIDVRKIAATKQYAADMMVIYGGITATEKKEQDLSILQWTQYAQKAEEVANNIKGVTGKVGDYLSTAFTAVSDVYKEEIKGIEEEIKQFKVRQEENTKEHAASTALTKKLEDDLNQAKITGNQDTIDSIQKRIDAEKELTKSLTVEQNKLANEEAQLNEKKAKKQKEQEKIEKLNRKVTLLKNIGEATANVAQGATKALSYGPILGPILAAIVTAAGVVQIGIMTKQLAKFADGGLLNGKRHSQGGMRIEGSNIEVEGGEYVVNRESTSKNLSLVRYINSERKELKPADLDSFFARSSRGFEPAFSRMMQNGGQLPIAEPTANIDNETLVQAIQSIRIEPRVAVSDIYRVQDSMVSVDGWAGV